MKYSQTKIAQTSYIGCKWIELQRCKWYEFSKKAEIKKRMKKFCKEANFYL